MIVLRCDQPARHLVLVFGVGLVGHAIIHAFRKSHSPSVHQFSFSWDRLEDQRVDRARLWEFLTAQRDEALRTIDIVWSAGRSGFSSINEDLSAETSALEQVLSLARQLSERFVAASHAFHFVSSAGGLFEGQINVDALSKPMPLRPYAETKLLQEEMLSLLRPTFKVCIYRPSTVYGFVSYSLRRQGLIVTLIQNALTYKVSRIFGRLQTIRDYVLSEDVGRFIASNLALEDLDSGTFLLASGKPTTIAEIVTRVESISERKIYREILYDNSNIADNSFAPVGLPKRWSATSLEPGIRITVRRMVSGGAQTGFAVGRSGF